LKLFWNRDSKVKIKKSCSHSLRKTVEPVLMSGFIGRQPAVMIVMQVYTSAPLAATANMYSPPVPWFTFQATQRRHPLTGTKLYCMVTEAHKCEQLVSNQRPLPLDYPNTQKSRQIKVHEYLETDISGAV